ncbi:MAG: CCA tRNA nucleotidyltransferase [Sphingomonadaceae bacterium]|nr:CCA tRNA nucleotidyltransferase [Sphingomonadaceae bacterium]
MTERLPHAPWQDREDLAEVIEALGPGNARYVGGAVRDTLMGIAVKDVDLATPLLPGEVIARLNRADIRTVPTGIEHGTVTAVLPLGPVEITTLRHDVSTDGRRATVAFTTEWQDDAARRDFTMNALFADPATKEITDFFSGLEDLSERRVRFIGDARQRIQEDHLRILRYFRFQARFGSHLPDLKAETACTELAATLKGLSRERVGMEMMNILGLTNPAPTIKSMQELGVLGVILSEADPAALNMLVQNEEEQGAAPDALRRLAALLPPDPTLAKQVASRFRLSNAQKKRLVCASARDNDPGTARALAYRLGRDEALDRLLMAGADTAPLSGWDIPQLPLKGGEIVQRGIAAGPDVARILQAVETRWVDEGFPGRDRVDQLLDEELTR